MTNPQASSSGSTSGGSSSGSGSSGTGGSEREGNNGKDQKQKDNTDKQMGICVVGVESPCNGDSGFDGRDDTSRQWILSNGCGDNNDNHNNNDNNDNGLGNNDGTSGVRKD